MRGQQRISHIYRLPENPTHTVYSITYYSGNRETRSERYVFPLPIERVIEKLRERHRTEQVVQLLSFQPTTGPVYRILVD